LYGRFNPMREIRLNKRGYFKASRWLALLAFSVQLVLPLAVGLQISRDGAAATLSLFETGLCQVDHGQVASAEKPSQQPSNPHNNSTEPSCPLCLVLQAWHGFTDTTVAAIAAPIAIDGDLLLASIYTDAPSVLSVSYNSRAPPTLS
jgi:hypothetical protein